MNMQFGFGEIREFRPEYADINWRDVYLARHNEEESAPVWAELEDELGAFVRELNQSNCCFYLNDSDPSFDCVVVVDDRDPNGDFWFSRGNMGNEVFDDLLENIGSEVMVVSTKYPAQKVAEFVLRNMLRDMEEITEEGEDGA